MYLDKESNYPWSYLTSTKMAVTRIDVTGSNSSPAPFEEPNIEQLDCGWYRVIFCDWDHWCGYLGLY